MNSRDRVRTIISGKPADRCGFWLGNPHGDTRPIYYEYFGTTDPRDIRRRLGDDYLWVCLELIPGSYRHPGSARPRSTRPDQSRCAPREGTAWLVSDTCTCSAGASVVSPSHEALLPNVPPENVVAMAEAAVE